MQLGAGRSNPALGSRGIRSSGAMQSGARERLKRDSVGSSATGARSSAIPGARERCNLELGS
eukprot:13330533-Alexandrium_andersonii.AAC.1